MSAISYTVSGKGNPVVFLHGFPMDRSVWTKLAEDLQSDFQVYTPDLPGFGESTPLQEGFTLDVVADLLLQWLAELKVQPVVIIGHSLGGYVALAMVEKAPHSFRGLGLFHSTSYPDSDEKKESRTKTIEFIHRNGVLAFTANFIQPLFADAGHPAIEKVRALAMQSTTSAVVGYLQAMRDRPGRESVLKQFSKPVFILGGEQDKGIPALSLEHQAGYCLDPHLFILPNMAHMAMYESPEKTGSLIRSFLQRCDLGYKAT